jgi:hypothetical protein
VNDPAILPIGEPPPLKRVNGFGLIMGGVNRHPELGPWFLKQLVITGAFIPVAFGHIYLVRPGEAGRSWYFGGRMTGAELVRRYGWGAYFRLKATAIIEVIAWGVAVVILILLVSFGVRWAFGLFAP